jgi:hypothetical protein
MEVVSAKVDKRLRDKMRKLGHVNWSEVIRCALSAKVEEEEAKLLRSIDKESLMEASSMTDQIRKSSKGWNSTEEIRRWREARVNR